MKVDALMDRCFRQIIALHRYPIVLEIPLILTFISVRFVTHEIMKEFMTKLYNYDHKQSDYAENSSEEDEIHVEFGEVLEATDVESVSTKKEKKKKSCNLQRKLRFSFFVFLTFTAILLNILF